MATLIHTPGSIEISAERPVPVQTRDVKSPSGDVESSVTNPLTCSEELPSVEIYVEILGDSDDDDSEDGSDDEKVKNFLVRIIKMTLASEKQAEDPDLPQAAAENQQVDTMTSLPPYSLLMLILLPMQSEGGMSFLVMLAPCRDTDTLDEDSGEPVSTLNEMPQDRVARVSQLIAHRS